MAKMYPENQTLRMNGVDVQWPGVDAEGKFTNGDFNNPETPPSFIPAETINLLLDNIGGIIEELGATPNNTDGDQLRNAFSNFVEKRLPSLTHAFKKERYLVFDFTDTNHRSLKIKNGTRIRLDISNPNGSKERRYFSVDNGDLIYNLDNQIRAAALATTTRTGEENGRNFYVYLVPLGETETELVVSCNSTFPNDISADYTANNTRKIGQFHTLCRNAGSDLKGKIDESPSCGLHIGDRVLVKQYDSDDEDGFYDFYNVRIEAVTVGAYHDVVKVHHPLAGFRAGEILPESVWCLSFRPYSNPNGMVYDVDTDLPVDIYIASGTGTSTASEYDATATTSRAHPNHQGDMRHIKKRLLYDHEFSSAALGSNERTNIKNSANPVRVGGHVDTEDSRMLSFIGCEDCCGVWWQWLEDVAAAGTSVAWGNTNAVGSGSYTDGRIEFTNTWYSMDGQDAFGAMYACNTALLAGGVGAILRSAVLVPAVLPMLVLACLRVLRGAVRAA